MKVLSREEILGASDLPVERVEVPEWGGAVYVRPMMAAEQDRLAADKGATENVNSRMLAFCVCDETGKALFTEDDIAALSRKSWAATIRVLTAIARINAGTVEERENISKN